MYIIQTAHAFRPTTVLLSARFKTHFDYTANASISIMDGKTPPKSAKIDDGAVDSSQTRQRYSTSMINLGQVSCRDFRSISYNRLQAIPPTAMALRTGIGRDRHFVASDGPSKSMTSVALGDISSTVPSYTRWGEVEMVVTGEELRLSRSSYKTTSLVGYSLV